MYPYDKFSPGQDVYIIYVAYGVYNLEKTKILSLHDRWDTGSRYTYAEVAVLELGRAGYKNVQMNNIFELSRKDEAEQQVNDLNSMMRVDNKVLC